MALRVVRNSNLAGNTAAAAESLAPEIGKKLENLLSVYLEAGEKMPDFELVQKLLGRLLKDRDEDLQKKDHASEVAVMDARVLRLARDEAAGELREVLRAVRHYLDQARGRGEGARCGIGNGLSWMAPVELVGTARRITVLLESLDREGGARPVGLLPPAELAAAVREKKNKLAAVLERLYPQNALEDHNRCAKNQSTEAAEKAVRRASAVLAGLYKLCEFEDLAKVVRPVFRRRRRKKGNDKSHTLTYVPIWSEEGAGEPEGETVDAGFREDGNVG